MRLFSMKSFFTLIFGLILGIAFNSSIAEHAASIKVFSDHEKELHEQRMKNMTTEERNRYRNEQYQILRNRAAAIGYTMPDTPPWATADNNSAATETPATDGSLTAHEKQLNDYRQEAADKRKAMHERIEKQRQEIKKRIASLVEKNGVKATTPQPAPSAPNFQPVPMPPPMAPMPPPNYQRYYMMPPMPFYRY